MDFFSFEGRIGRGEWWGLSILLFVIGLVATVISIAVFPPLLFFVYLAVLVSTLGINTRRCHDLGWSGWMQLVNFVPVIGGLILFVALGFVPGQAGPNKFDYPAGLPYGHGGYSPYHHPPAQQTYQPSMQQSYQTQPQQVETGFQPDLVHPSLREANQRAWQSNQNQQFG